MEVRKYSREHDELREDQIAFLFLHCFNLLGEYSKRTSGEIRAMIYEMIDEIE